MTGKIIVMVLAMMAGAPAPLAAQGLAPMAEDALAPLTRDKNIGVFLDWRENGVERIERIRAAAANKLRRNQACEMLDYVGFAEDRSDYPAEIVVYGECADGSRIYLTETEARALR